MVKGLNSPIGSKIFAEIFNTDRFVVGSSFACSESSAKSNVNRSVAVFQIEPNTLTVVLLQALLASSGGPFVVLAYDSSSSVMVFLLPVTIVGSTWSSD